MRILNLGEDRFKISLDRLEALRLFGDCKNIDCTHSAVKAKLDLLLKRAPDAALSLKNGHIYDVDLIRNRMGGYDIYYLRKACTDIPISKKACLLFEFDDVNALTGGAAQLQKRADIIEKSRLFRFNGRYRLIIEIDSRTPRTFLGIREFARGISCSKILTAVTEEHGRELIGADAVALLSTLQ